MTVAVSASAALLMTVADDKAEDGMSAVAADGRDEEDMEVAKGEGSRDTAKVDRGVAAVHCERGTTGSGDVNQGRRGVSAAGAADEGG